MKWGRKKQSLSSSSRPSLISHVFPNSWLAKFKQMSINSGEKHKKEKRGEKSQCSSGGDGLVGRFYGGDGDAFWRISFGEDSVLDGKKNRGVLASARYDAEEVEEETEFPLSACQSCKSNATEVIIGKNDSQMFRSMVSDARNMNGLAREKGDEIRTPRLKLGRDKRFKKASQKVFELKQVKLNGESYAVEEAPRKAEMKSFSEAQQGRTMGIIEREDCKLAAADSVNDCYISPMKSRDSYLKIIEEDYLFGVEKGSAGYSSESLNFDWQKLKEMKIEELKAKGEKQRKSQYISRELQRKRSNSKVRAYSPRTPSKVEVCKIKALEDMKKAKLKKKKKAKHKTMEEFSGLENFAVVKCSFDPQKDFRESMIEMIQENRIRKPEELEELLACYLTLNSDDYHDLIIQVFRQVWFDLNEVCFDEELDAQEECFYD